MERQKKARAQRDHADDDDYIAAAEVARLYGVSVHTIRRRIVEGTIFPGAKKEPAPGTGAGEMWVIPRSEVGSTSLREISPRTYYKGLTQLEPSAKDEHGSLSSIAVSELYARASILENRVSVLEQQVVKLLSLGSNRR
jgi:hypothetical protein